MTRTTLLCLRCLPASAFLALCTAAVQGQAPAVFAETSATPTLLIAANNEAASVPELPLGVAAPSPVRRDDIGSDASGVSSSLPDAPSALAGPAESSTAEPFSQSSTNMATPNVAPRLTKYIPAGMTAQTINGRDKFLIGIRDLYSPLNFIAMVASAGYEQALNGAPNYGTDKGAFGQRLGAAAIRESTQGFFTDSVFSPILHEDPRYYTQGPSHNIAYRAVYAATRPLITKTDSGSHTINGALLLGYAASAALSYTYYPAINQNFHDIASAYGGSVGGAALGFVVSEFSDDILKAVHLRK